MHGIHLSCTLVEWHITMHTHRQDVKRMGGKVLKIWWHLPIEHLLFLKNPLGASTSMCKEGFRYALIAKILI